MRNEIAKASRAELLQLLYDSRRENQELVERNMEQAELIELLQAQLRMAETDHPAPASERLAPLPERPAPLPERPAPLPERPAPLPEYPAAEPAQPGYSFMERPAADPQPVSMAQAQPAPTPAPVPAAPSREDRLDRLEQMLLAMMEAQASKSAQAEPIAQVAPAAQVAPEETRPMVGGASVAPVVPEEIADPEPEALPMADETEKELPVSSEAAGGRSALAAQLDSVERLLDSIRHTLGGTAN